MLGYLFIALIFFLVAFLYGYGQIYRNMLYAAVIVLFFGGVFVLADYIRIHHQTRHKLIQPVFCSMQAYHFHNIVISICPTDVF